MGLPVLLLVSGHLWYRQSIIRTADKHRVLKVRKITGGCPGIGAGLGLEHTEACVLRGGR